MDPDKIRVDAGLMGHLLVGIIYTSRINVVKIYGTSWELEVFLPHWNFLISYPYQDYL